jgi:hypothetical protein
LLAVGPDVAKLLAVVTLCKGFIILYLEVIWQRLGSLKISWDFAVLAV